jgi:hypothetical protein
MAQSSFGAHLVSGVMQLRELSEGVESNKMVEWHDAILLGATDESEMVPLPSEDVVIHIREGLEGAAITSDEMSDVRLSSDVFDV